MITTDNWKQIKHFKSNEKDYRRRKGAFGDLNLFQFNVLWLLDQQTDFAKTILYPDRKIYCIVHYGTQGTHSKNSQHSLGLAVDVHYTNMSLYEQVILASMFPWNAIGFYPTWLHQGLHLDLRVQEWYKRKTMWFTYGVYEDEKWVIKYEYRKDKIIEKIGTLNDI